MCDEHSDVLKPFQLECLKQLVVTPFVAECAARYAELETPVSGNTPQACVLEHLIAQPAHSPKMVQPDHMRAREGWGRPPGRTVVSI
jgi:hypothetical protein